jgi:hypothetical protein
MIRDQINHLKRKLNVLTNNELPLYSQNIVNKNDQENQRIQKIEEQENQRIQKIKKEQENQRIQKIKKEQENQRIQKIKKEQENQRIQKIEEQENQRIQKIKKEKEIRRIQKIEEQENRNIKVKHQQLIVQDNYSNITLDKLVANKSVIIVGPAAYLNYQENGDLIDGFDIVVRINRGSFIKNNMKNKIGSKLDILFSNLNINDTNDKKSLDTNYLKNKGVKMIFCPYPNVQPFTDDKQQYFNYYKNTFPIETIDTQFYLHIQSVLQTRPNTGILAILILLRQNIKNLYITGFSFYRDGYYNGYKDNSKPHNVLKNEIVRYHDQNSQKNILKKIFLNNDKIFLDKTIISILFPTFITIHNNINSINFRSTYDYININETCPINKIVTNYKKKILFLRNSQKNIENLSNKYNLIFYINNNLNIKNGVYLCETINNDPNIKHNMIMYLFNIGKKDKNRNIFFNETIIKWIQNNLFRTSNQQLSRYICFIYVLCLCKDKSARIYFLKDELDNDSNSEHLIFLEKMGLCIGI